MRPGGMSERLISEAVDRAQDALVFFRMDGSIVFANPSCAHVLGWDPAQLEQRNVVTLLHPDDLRRAAVAVDAVLGADESRQRTSGVIPFLQPGGSYRLVDITGTPLVDDDGETVLMMSARPVDERRLFNEVLATFTAEPVLADMLAPIPEFLRWRPDGPCASLVWRDASGSGLVGDQLPDRLVGMPGGAEMPDPWRLAWQGSSVDVDVEDLTVADRELASRHDLVHAWVRPITDLRGEVRGVFTMWCRSSDHPAIVFTEPLATALRLGEAAVRWFDQQQRLHEQATTDALTGVMNRRSFEAALESIDATQGERSSLAVLCVDLDGFKPVNDRFGHEAGDQVLAEVAGRLREVVRPSDLVARLGGDEFAVFCPECSTTDAWSIAERVLEVCRRPVALIDGDPVEVRVSVGAAVGPADSAALLRRAADLAMYEAKHSGGDDARMAASLT